MQIEKDKNLKEFTTFRIGGPAQFFCSVKNEDDVQEAVVFAQMNKLETFVLGGGSNILISDAGFQGLVIKMEIMGIEFKDERVIVAAGENWDELVGMCVEKGLYGIETLSLIPGTVGAAPVQNIGAYGSEVKDTVESVRVYDTVENVFKDFLNTDCQFEYRNSLFKREAGRYIIVSTTFILKKNGKPNISYKDLREFFKGKENPTLLEVRNAVIEIRTRKLPDVKLVGTAGSFFKNPIITHGQANELKKNYPELPVYPVDDTYVKVSLGWILDHVCGYKGKTVGNVGAYKNQALVLVNNGDATAEEVLALAEKMKHDVREKTGIEIEMEVQLI